MTVFTTPFSVLLAKSLGIGVLTWLLMVLLSCIGERRRGPWIGDHYLVKQRLTEADRVMLRTNERLCQLSRHFILKAGV
jgi:hypothetical protein